jgi:hypothetical protein
MVSPARGAPDTRRVRRLAEAQPIEVEATVSDAPRRVRLGARWLEVNLARDPWCVNQLWWRSDPVRRTYYRVTPADGPPFTIYYDEVTGDWYRQEYV